MFAGWEWAGRIRGWADIKEWVMCRFSKMGRRRTIKRFLVVSVIETGERRK
jgi:hypothetical protein